MSTVQALLRRYGRTFAQEAGIPVARGTPAPLFQLLVLALLGSAPIRHAVALRATRALLRGGLTTPRKMADAPWQRRVDLLGEGGYRRYDERTSTLLGQTSDRLLVRYGGDLRRLHDEAEGDVAALTGALKAFQGIGGVGAAIFLREVQVAWRDVFPYADDRVLEAARVLGLGDDPSALRRHADAPEPYAKLVASLVRAQLDGALDTLRAAPT